MMNQLNLIGTLIAGGAVILLPLVMPVLFFQSIKRKVLFYFVGLASSYLCYKVAIFLWAVIVFPLGSIIASVRHEDSRASIGYSFDLVAPGMKQGHMWFAILPMLILGTLLSVLALKKLKAKLFKLEMVA